MVMTHAKDTDWDQVLVGEILSLGLIGKSFYVYPARDWVKSLIDGDLFAEAPFASNQPDAVLGLQTLQNWCEKNRAGLPSTTFDSICADYTRLFIGPGVVIAPPWESVHFSEERLVFQQETLEVRDWYRRFGLQSEKMYQEPDDHIGLELEFVAHLARLGLAATEKNDTAAFEESIKAQRDFLTEHLFRWAPSWCDLVEKNAQTDFYRGMARLCKGVVSELATVLDVKLA